MDRTISCGSVEQQLELKDLAQAVIGPLKRGLCSFNVLEMLLSIDADIVLPGCPTFSDVRSEIVNMKQQMEESEQVATNKLHCLDEETERLTAEQSLLAEQKKQRESELENLKTQLESYRSSLESYTEALETERRNLRSAEDTLDGMRKRRDTAEIVRNVGIGVTFIPFWGWIAGPAMIVGGAIDMSQASDAVDRAKKEVENCESQVNSYSNKVSEYRSSIHQAERDIQETDRKIDEAKAKLQALTVKREVVADVQAKVRRAVRQLGLLCGVGSAAELQTRHQILLEPVVKVMEEMTAALGHITGEDLLHTEGIKKLMLDLKTNQNKLKQLPDTKKSSDDYY
ncbi:uncharacterized protein LOC108873868 [Lates calcarifer]|uniref:Uncharacterized protein LOC108873868 n=1 Tax=Lates calcarifer TaxID=8187 RepID=A0AAJ7LAT7_LATCA|nr:uncharacterized protein LOC108873868 [Lates calcarifer]XP_018517715.1 uncharacterized protein LOC108873868 [Lates calcarifer]XP_018517716.1 uncharacterized protein LOC108873868 [Lates calcarifer]